MTIAILTDRHKLANGVCREFPGFLPVLLFARWIGHVFPRKNGSRGALDNADAVRQVTPCHVSCRHGAVGRPSGRFAAQGAAYQAT